LRGQVYALGEVLKKKRTFTVPAYQRPYQWDDALWQGLVSDVAQLDSNQKSVSHWMGILLVSKEEEAGVFAPEAETFKIIDGQQRSVTIRLWLAALAHHFEDKTGKNLPKIDQKAISQIRVQESDRLAFDLAVTGKWRTDEAYSHLNSRVFRAYIYFRFVLWLGDQALLEEEPIPTLKRFKKANSEKLFEVQWEEFRVAQKARGNLLPGGKEVDAKLLSRHTLERLSLFMVVHEPDKDEPEAVIFDTLNGMRMELAPLDHVRTHVFVRLKNFEEKDFYKAHWEPAETRLRQIATLGIKSETAFIYDYLISRGEEANQGKLKSAKGGSHFATMMNRRATTADEFEKIVRTEVIPNMLVWPVVVRANDEVRYDGQLKTFSARALDLMTNIRDLTQGPANPLVLLYAVAFVQGHIPDAKELENRLFAIENYLVRQIMGNRPLSPMRSQLMGVMSKIAGSLDQAVLESALVEADWVSNETILEMAIKRDYESIKSGAVCAIMRGIERKISGPGAQFFRFGAGVGEFSKEHIFPRKHDKWRADLKKWGTTVESMSSLRETLGNLTFVTQEHNSKAGNSTFDKKVLTSRTEGNSPDLGINQGWVKKRKWTEVEIKERSKLLATKAIDYWPDLGKLKHPS
jgi:hypothetical protein